MKLSQEAKQIIADVHPAYVATANKHGRPNVAPKGSFRALDDDHVIFNEGGQLHTLANLRENPQVAAVVYSPDTQRGCRIWGKAEILENGALFDRIAAEAASRGRTVKYLVKVAVDELVVF